MCALSRQAGRRFPAGGMTPHAESRKVGLSLFLSAALRNESQQSSSRHNRLDVLYLYLPYLILSVLITSARRFRLLSQGPSGDCTHSELLNQQEGIIKMWSGSSYVQGSVAHCSRQKATLDPYSYCVGDAYLCMHPAISVSAACTARSGLDCDIVFLTDDAQRSEGNQTSYHWRWPERSLLCCEAVSELLNTILDAVVGPDTCRGQHPSERERDIYIGNRQNTWSKTLDRLFVR